MTQALTVLASKVLAGTPINLPSDTTLTPAELEGKCCVVSVNFICALFKVQCQHPIMTIIVQREIGF